MGCDVSQKLFDNGIKIFQSTHPSWGATLKLSTYSIFKQNFNPRTHRGVRHYDIGLTVFRAEFQSTHPSWGATQGSLSITNVLTISIHAPIVGCDASKSQELEDIRKISIHAPIVGCDI